MADETVYMQRLNQKILNLIGSFAPLYTLTYKFFHFFIKDYINLHHFAIISLSWVPGVGLYFFLKSKQIPFAVSAYLAWCLFVSSFILAFDWWPRISHYSLFLIFIFFTWLFNYTKNIIKILLFVGCFALLLSFVRPEFFMSSLALFAFAFLVFIYQKIKQKNNTSILTLKEKLIVLAVFISAGLMTLAWHSPLYGGRMYYAMGQHYTFNTIKWNKQDRTPFIYWEQIFKEKFGNSQTVSDMYKANPKELKRHITENVKSYFIQLFEFTSELFLPKCVFKFHFAFKWLILLAVFLALLFKTSIKNYKEKIIEAIQEHGIFIFCIAILVGPSVVASMLIFPREHYYILQLALIYYIFYILFIPFFKTLKPDFKYQNIVSIGLLIILLFLTPNIKCYPRFNSFQQYDKPNYLPYIYAVRDLKITKPTTFLVSDILPIYMGENFRVNIQFLKHKPFEKMLKEDDIGIMYVSPILLNDTRFTSDSTWVYFINNYEKLGWNKLQLTNRKEYVIYKKDLLP